MGEQRGRFYHKRKSDEGNGEGKAGELMLPLYFMGTQKRFGLPAVPVPRSENPDLNVEGKKIH